KLSGIHRVMEPPDPIPNSVVKRGIADGSVGLPHVRVGQCQAYTKQCMNKRHLHIRSIKALLVIIY
ncbi:MAG: Unknown protein, partial [uncultured Thiotrichaceae bacterium]